MASHCHFDWDKWHIQEFLSIFDSGFICSHRVDGLELWSCNQSLADDCGSHLFWWSEWVELVLVKYGFLSFPCHQQSIAAEHCQQQTHVKQLLTKYKPITATVHMSPLLTTRITMRLVSSHLLTLQASASRPDWSQKLYFEGKCLSSRQDSAK